MVAIQEPGAIVGGENHQRAFVETILLQALQDFTHRPVEFLNHVSVQAAFRFALMFA